MKFSDIFQVVLSTVLLLGFTIRMATVDSNTVLAAVINTPGLLLLSAYTAFAYKELLNGRKP